MKRIVYSFLAMSLTVTLWGASSTAVHAQLLKTNLSIFVVDEVGNVQAGAKVSLYETEEDYKAKQNPVVTNRFTDEKGMVKIKKLAAKEYFVHVEKGDKNNAGGGVKTGKLVEKRTNKVNIVISGI